MNTNNIKGVCACMCVCVHVRACDHSVVDSVEFCIVKEARDNFQHT